MPPQPKYVHILIPKPVTVCTFHGKREFADIVKNLEATLDYLSRLSAITRVLMRGRQKGQRARRG